MAKQEVSTYGARCKDKTHVVVADLTERFFTATCREPATLEVGLTTL